MGQDASSIPEISVGDSYEWRSAAKHGGYTWMEFRDLERTEQLTCYAYYRLEGMLHRVAEIKPNRKKRT